MTNEEVINRLNKLRSIHNGSYAKDIDMAIKVLDILANADEIIKSRYGWIIVEGYADVIDQMKEVFEEVNADADSN